MSQILINAFSGLVSCLTQIVLGRFFATFLSFLAAFAGWELRSSGPCPSHRSPHTSWSSDNFFVFVSIFVFVFTSVPWVGPNITLVIRSIHEQTKPHKMLNISTTNNRQRRKIIFKLLVGKYPFANTKALVVVRFFFQITKSNDQYIGTVSISSLIYWWDINKLITGHCRVNFLWQVFLTMFNYRQILGRFKLQSGDLFPLARADPTSAVNFIFLRETCPLIKEMLKLRRFGWKICIVYDTVNIFGV